VKGLAAQPARRARIGFDQPLLDQEVGDETND
jgi:hypothetical protein